MYLTTEIYHVLGTRSSKVSTRKNRATPHPPPSIPMQKVFLSFTMPDRSPHAPLPLPQVCGNSVDVLGPQLRQRIPTGQNPIDLVIRIPLHAIALIVQIRQHLIHEIGLLLHAATGLELSQPDGAPARHGLRFLDVVLERLDAVIVRVAVPMDGDKVDLAARARGHEFLQPGQSDLAAAVAHRGAADLDRVAEFLHVVPRVGGLLGRHVRLGGEVGLVEAEDVGCAVGDGGLDVGFPVWQVEFVGAPEHGNEIHA